MAKKQLYKGLCEDEIILLMLIEMFKQDSDNHFKYETSIKGFSHSSLLLWHKSQQGSDFWSDCPRYKY